MLTCAAWFNVVCTQLAVMGMMAGVYLSFGFTFCAIGNGLVSPALNQCTVHVAPTTYPVHCNLFRRTTTLRDYHCYLWSLRCGTQDCMHLKLLIESRSLTLLA